MAGGDRGGIQEEGEEGRFTEEEEEEEFLSTLKAVGSNAGEQAPHPRTCSLRVYSVVHTLISVYKCVQGTRNVY